MSDKIRRTKWDTHVEPRLIEVTGWAREGIIDKDIAKKLGVAYSTFRTYRDENPALAAALKKGKEVVDFEVEDSLYNRAMGYEYDEVKTYIEETNGIIKKKKEVTTKHLPGDVTAMIFWLKNRKPELWRDRRELDHKVFSSEDIDITIDGVDMDFLGGDGDVED